MDFQATLFARKSGNVLPSPPESPSMYAYPPAPGEHGRYTTRLASRHILPAPSGNVAFGMAEKVRQANEKASGSLSQANLPCDGWTSPHSPNLHQTVPHEQSSAVDSEMRTPESSSPDRVSNHPPREEDHLEQRPTRAFSTASQPTPQLVLTEAEHLSEGDELYTGSEEEDIAGGTNVLKSGAERLAEKRKMKRFRLTHAQTRYLMSEFSRQAHPDAAQRERLSRDIPGLNPRQVQVWFQNRRAKLKRLTTDDQERMRRSRALPEDFDFSQTLQPAFREVRPTYGSVLTDPLMLGGGTCQKPSLRLGTGPLSMASNSMSSIFTGTTLSPVSASGSANPSPVSSGNGGSESSSAYFSSTQSPLVASPRFTNPFGRSHSLSVGSPAFQCQGRPSSQNGTMGSSNQPNAATSSSRPALACNSYGFGNLPPLQISRTPFQTRDGQRFDRFPNTEGLSHESGLAMNQHYISPLSSPSGVCYDQSQMLYPSSSGYRASSYYPSPDTNFWQGSQMSAGGQEYEQQTRPHQMTEERRGSQPPRSAHSPDASLNSYNQGSYSHSSEQYSKEGTSTNAHALEPTQRGADATTDANRLPTPAVTRPRARSDTYPAYYTAH